MDSREPGIPATKGDPLAGRSIPKNVINISHADAWAYGTNFFSLDILKSGNQDPSGFAFPRLGERTGVGATEAYGLYRGTLSGNALTGTKAFTFPGIVKDISLSYGTDLNSKNTSFGSEKRLVVAGLNFALDVPAGFLNVSVHASKEFNRNGIVPLPARAVEFNFTPEIEIVYNIPLRFTGLPLSLAGFNNIVMPKGRDGFGAETVTEFLSRTNLVLDIGKLVYDQPNKVDAFVASSTGATSSATTCAASLAPRRRPSSPASRSISSDAPRAAADPAIEDGHDGTDEDQAPLDQGLRWRSWRRIPPGGSWSRAPASSSGCRRGAPPPPRWTRPSMRAATWSFPGSSTPITTSSRRSPAPIRWRSTSRSFPG